MSFSKTPLVGVSVYEKNDGSQSFRVQAGQEYLGVATSLRHAVELLEEHGAEVRWRSDPAGEADLFIIMGSMFSDWFPTDWHSHFHFMKKVPTDHPHMSAHPLMYRIFLLLKEADARQFWVDWYSELAVADKMVLFGATSVSPKQAQGAFKLAFDGLRQLAMHMTSVDRAWANTHLNRSMAHHSGLMATLHGCHIIQKSETGRLNFGGAMRYDLLKYSEEAGEHFRGMAAEQAAMSSVADSSPLGTTAEWRTAVSKMGKSSGSYRELWLCRATLVGARMARGLCTTGLKVEKNLTLKGFSQAFPDSNEYVVRLGKYFKCKTVKELMKKLKYKGHAEYFTMYLCLFLDKRVRKHNRAAIAAREKHIHAARKKHKNRQKHEGHPAVVIDAVMRDAD